MLLQHVEVPGAVDNSVHDTNSGMFSMPQRWLIGAFSSANTPTAPPTDGISLSTPLLATSEPTAPPPDGDPTNCGYVMSDR